MNRTILALAATIFATLTIIGSAAQAACISCEHVPVVVRGSATSHSTHSYAKKRYLKKRAYAAAAKRKKLAAAKRARLAAAKRKKLAAAKRARLPAAKRVKISKVVTKAVENTESVSIKATTEQSSVSTASLDKNKDAVEEPKAGAKQTCKKFFPTVSMTLTVPCE